MTMPAQTPPETLGFSGSVARAFQANAITPLLALVALLLGLFAVLVTPREEEPQINVTMANVIIPFPGASSADVAKMVAQPAEHVLSQDDMHVQVDMFDRLPTPFGLVRAGVAPDHPKIKSVTRVYDKIAQNPDFRFRGNVEFGTDLEYEDLLEYFHAVIYCVGARSKTMPGGRSEHPATLNTRNQVDRPVGGPGPDRLRRTASVHRPDQGGARRVRDRVVRPPDRAARVRPAPARARSAPAPGTGPRERGASDPAGSASVDHPLTG
jgi:hypothetical protein